MHALLILGCLASSMPPDAAESSSTQISLVGEKWAGTYDNMKLVIKSRNGICFSEQDDGTGLLYVWPIRLIDEGNSSCRISIGTPTGRALPEFLGIYKLDESGGVITLTICWGASRFQRPKVFKAGDGRALSILKRVK